ILERIFVGRISHRDHLIIANCLVTGRSFAEGRSAKCFCDRIGNGTVSYRGYRDDADHWRAWTEGAACVYIAVGKKLLRESEMENKKNFLFLGFLCALSIGGAA